MKIKTLNQTLIIKAALISVFFEAYCITYVGNYPITLFTIVGAISIAYSLFRKGLNNLCKIDQTFFALIMFCAYLIINYLGFGCKNTASLLQYLFLLLTFASFRRKTSRSSYEDLVTSYQKWLNFFSLYGIYQLFARMIGLPFADVIIPGHMVNGYNWTNIVYGFGPGIFRSNAIFREPSYFGQLLAINILLFVVKLLSNEGETGKKKKNWIWLVINCIAYLTTMSGTGLIIIIFGLLIYLTSINKTKKIVKRIVVSSILIGAGAIFIISFTSVGNYLIGRIRELMEYNSNSSSGYVRFKAWTELLQGDWKKSPLFGIGIGASKGVTGLMRIKYYGFTLNGISKIIIEIGLLGIVLWGYFIFSFFKRKENISGYYSLIVAILIPFFICHEASTSNTYWFFLALINCKFVFSPQLLMETAKSG